MLKKSKRGPDPFKGQGGAPRTETVMAVRGTEGKKIKKEGGGQNAM